MPRFKYKAISPDGRIQKGEKDAISHDVVIQNLQSQGFLPIEAWEVESRNLLNSILSRISVWRKTASQRDVEVFMGELATLLNSGLPLDHALKTIEDLTEKQVMRKVIQALLGDVQGGDTLSDAMAKLPSVFTRLQINMVRAGEASGSLHTVIKGLAEYMERMSGIRNAVITTLIYPSILLFMSILSLFVMMAFVVPKFVPLFEDVGQTLPLVTRITFASAEFLQNTWWIGFCVAIIIFWYVDRLLSNPQRRKRFDGLCLKVIYLGNLIKHVDTARFARTLGTLLRNGVPLLTSVKLVKDVIANRQLSEVIETSISSLEQGQGLATHLRSSRYFPPLSTQLIEVGEQSGNLDEMLLKVADIYDNELQKSLKKMLVLLEPLLILGLGGLIGFIIISILVAMLGLNELVL